ncbi:mechanosensitive ion channel family protein [Zymomonas mobilis]|uniref:MscS Mechanosensitive ion channel n=1 Tax=Zymomonas mobilis subsp. pomaceae (strain ATCC 29192 / DSM 22645 / JCM 10191 / CCUG 17912 / NBRC 13757 / NCIMB 11200 / NRRL B-4491 / Barker I) TaxID=579138 RepID=F8EUT5_ZYMMT|nr:mechanosensitive ion channel family protein [Zymomonas mobilis]AEI38231.1 MscS Mechanosensitive ion channel [Zymomonas mobilis subsp. pomaceae ATCC 29192]MDX5947921.1 mechanosensitive ion channel family protein [Zymomonas mobilis subsp. pomaceae]GEB89982.1 mechanosensitive ion channel protein MscS [Zymomonas mobilis subsp. pomaceae]
MPQQTDNGVLTSPEEIALMHHQITEWFSQHYIQLLIAMTIGILLFFGLLTLRRMAERFLKRSAFLSEWTTIVGEAVGRTNIFFLAILTLRLITSYTGSSERIYETIQFLWVIASTLQFAIWARQLILGLITYRVEQANNTNRNLDNALNLIQLLVSLALFLVAAIVILDNLGVNVTGLIAGLGIGGIAIGLAAKGIFDDLFSALVIIFDQPFRKGDIISWKDSSGTVERIGLKTTRIRAGTGEEIIVANNMLVNLEMHNLSEQTRQRFSLQIGVVCSTTPTECEKLVSILREEISQITLCKVVRSCMKGIGASSFDFEIVCDVQSGVPDDYFSARTQACINILKRLEKEGIVLAYPTVTNYNYNADKAIFSSPE